jgi:hypothetical protein
MFEAVSLSSPASFLATTSLSILLARDLTIQNSTETAAAYNKPAIKLSTLELNPPGDITAVLFAAKPEVTSLYSQLSLRNGLEEVPPHIQEDERSAAEEILSQWDQLRGFLGVL